MTGGETDEQLARMVIRESPSAPRLDEELRRPLSAVARRHAAPRPHQRVLSRRRQGADEHLLRGRAEARHPTCSTTPRSSELKIRDGRFESGTWCVDGEPVEFRAKALVVASGGFESNLEWLGEILGRRGRQLHHPRHALQHGHACCKLLLDAGREPVGDPTQCHAVAIDARAPKFDGGIVTRLDCVPLGIVVNQHGERFYDEGEDFWPKRYAIWGRLVAAAAGSDRVFDHRFEGDRPLHAVGVSRRSRRQSSRELARRLGLTGRHARSDGATNSTAPCGRARSITRCSTIAAPTGLDAAEDPLGAARSIRRRSTAIRCGRASRSPISGVRVNERAQVRWRTAILRQHFRGGRDHGGQCRRARDIWPGSGMTIGSVFGRIAGQGGRACR